MSFPDLQLRTDPNSPNGVAELWAEATGVPDNGLNTFMIPFINQPPAGAGIDPAIVDEDWFVVDVFPQGPGVSNAIPAVPLISPDKQFMSIIFTADGVTAARVVVQLVHTEIR